VWSLGVSGGCLAQEQRFLPLCSLVLRSRREGTGEASGTLPQCHPADAQVLGQVGATGRQRNFFFGARRAPGPSCRNPVRPVFVWLSPSPELILRIMRKIAAKCLTILPVLVMVTIYWPIVRPLI
jgi:hypothetical protein